MLGARKLGPESDRESFSARQAQHVFDSRLRLVTRRLAEAPATAGETFTAADISVAYALQLGKLGADLEIGEAAAAYVARLKTRPGFQRALAACHLLLCLVFRLIVPVHATCVEMTVDAVGSPPRRHQQGAG